MTAPPIPTPQPGAIVSQQPNTRTGLSACRLSLDSRLYPDWLRVRVRVILRLAVYRQSVLASSPLRFTTSIFFQLNACGHSPYVTSSLTKVWPVVYSCCWSSPAKPLSGPSPAGIMTTFYFLRFETPPPPPTWRVRSPYLYPPETGRPSHNPRHWVPFSSPPTTRRATVEVFRFSRYSLRTDATENTIRLLMWVM
jgi:hypothetical protein